LCVISCLIDMIRKPKSIPCHYSDSLAVNSENLKSFLLSHSVPLAETESIVGLLSEYYDQKVDVILSACNGDDWAKLESFSSPLIVFIGCIDKIINDNKSVLSNQSMPVLKSFLQSLESWMIW
jgi:hypothetical protein